MTYRPRVYIHAPMRLTDQRREFRARVLGRLATAGMDPQEFGVSGSAARVAWTFERAAQLMDACQGAVILALPKYEFGPELRMPSEYAHYEGALALSKQIPTLVLTEENVHNAGIVYRGGGHFINAIPVEVADAGDSTVLDYLDSAEFQTTFEAWVGEVVKRSRIFIGYCSRAQSTADALIKYLMRDLGLDVIDWAMDFNAGSTIMAEIGVSIQSSRCGVFLFTRDDPLEGEGEQAAPRDNVIFEAGFCMAIRGARRTIVIREEGARMPADLGGVIYLLLKDRADTSSIQGRLRQALESMP